ncbi:MAG: HAMP domain-containing histidine kinase [Prevotellaceae bacterium]|jgi:signal transduction histidine kinase|nr:HAMP domain-containing histidine kinase [Prevotellaceae bacterium]
MKINYKQKLSLCFVVIFSLFTAGVVLFEQSREREHKTEALEEKLDAYVHIVHAALQRRSDYQPALDSLAALFPPHIRLSLIAADGLVVYDNVIAEFTHMENHAQRPEIVHAHSKGHGADIRISSSNDREYLYYAKRFDRYYIRVALPYDVQVRHFLKSGNLFLYYIVALFVLMLLLINYVASRFGKSIRQLRDFALHMENEKQKKRTEHSPPLPHAQFPNDELGEIGAKIAENFRKLKEGETAIALEQEKTRMLKHELTGNITHELRTPVAGIRGCLETVLEHPLTPEKERYFIESAYNQTLVLSELIQDMGLITKMEDASHSFHVEPVGICALLENLRNDLHAPLHEKNIRMEWNIPDDLTVKGNKNLLYSIFRNLTDNAIRYAGSDVVIRIDKYKDDDGFYHFSFSDTGVGIPDEYHLNRLFERFYRINEGRTRDTGGSGLGLSIVKNAVAFHKGTIIVKNRHGGGLEFLFSLPK